MPYMNVAIRGLCDGYYDEEVGVVDEPNMEIHFF